VYALPNTQYVFVFEAEQAFFDDANLFFKHKDQVRNYHRRDAARAGY
jgi:hypothetical protein